MDLFTPYLSGAQNGTVSDGSSQKSQEERRREEAEAERRYQEAVQNRPTEENSS
jgi:hypothetical protein